MRCDARTPQQQMQCNAKTPKQYKRRNYKLQCDVMEKEKFVVGKQWTQRLCANYS
jgi:hypothetical protein